MAITNFQEVENALTVLQEQLNSAFARQNHMIAQALNKNDRDYIGLVAQLNEVASESTSNAFQKGFDPSRRDRSIGNLVNSSLNIFKDGKTVVYNPSDKEDTEIAIDPYDDSELRDMIDGKQDILTAGDNIQINGNVISATDTVYDDTFVKELIDKEIIDRNDADANLQQQIDAFAGALIYIGTIDLDTSDVTQAALDARANELGKEPIIKGYVLVDNQSNDWWYDGTEWVNIGYYDIAQATNNSLGVVKGSTANMKVSVDGLGEMSVNGLQTALDGKANASDLTAHINNKSNPHAVTYSQLPDKPNIPITSIGTAGQNVIGAIYPNTVTFYKDKYIYVMPHAQVLDLRPLNIFENSDIGKCYTFYQGWPENTPFAKIQFQADTKFVYSEFMLGCGATLTLMLTAVISSKGYFKTVAIGWDN